MTDINEMALITKIKKQLENFDTVILKEDEALALVPIEPTESMIIDGFESEPDGFFSEPEVWEAYQAMSGCRQAAYRAKLCWAAMVAAALKRE